MVTLAVTGLPVTGFPEHMSKTTVVAAATLSGANKRSCTGDPPRFVTLAFTAAPAVSLAATPPVSLWNYSGTPPPTRGKGD
jgi:hypothetical protein